MPDTAQASSLAPLLECVSSELAQVEDWIQDQLVPENPGMRPLLEHLSRFRGKRLRAVQVLLMGKACGGLVPEHITVAGIIEMIHAATLVHDDLLDEAEQRRKLPSVHLEWGPHAAVLLGDWIYTKAFHRSALMEDPTCSRALAVASGRVCAGEIHQNLTRGDFDLSEADYLEQIDAKTAALYEAAGVLGTYYAGGSQELQDASAQHGLLTGRAFQMADDILDLIGEEERVGKSLGTDLARGKMTLPLIRLRDSLDDASRQILADAFGSGTSREVLWKEPLLGPWEEAIASSKREVTTQLNRASQALQRLPACDARDALYSLTEYVGSRNR